MIQRKVSFDKEAKAKLFKGVDTVGKMVALTLGSKGRNVVYRPIELTAMGGSGWPKVTNDGVSIAREIFLEDEAESMGADIIKQVCEKTNFEVGDGTSTSAILTHKLIEVGMKSDYPNQLRHELDKALSESIKLLEKKAIKVTSEEELLKVAKISSEDDTIAKLVTAAIVDAGETGKVFVEESGGLETTSEKANGFTFGEGFLAPFMINNPKKFEAVYNNVHVLLTDKKFVFNKEILPIFNDLANDGIRELIIVCQDVYSEALATIYQNIIQARFHCVVVKMPRDKQVFEDLADFTGANLISQDGNLKFSKAHLAVVQKVVVTKDSCTFIKGERTDIEKSHYNAKVDSLQDQLKTSKGEEKNKATDRLSRLTLSSVVIKAGAATTTEMKYLKDKIDDAVCAVKAAKAEGYVTGGGLTLRFVCREVNEKLKTEGSELLSVAADMPVQVLIANAGGEYDPSKINEMDGFDTDSGKYIKNLIEKGIIDPVSVTKSALTNSVSTAGIFLTIGGLIEDAPKSVVK